jgi:hypothetical protein
LSSKLPPPPDPFDLPYNVETWSTRKSIMRVHHCRFGATEFNPGAGDGRFHPLHDGAGNPVPTLYGASTFFGAVSETVFHNIPVTGPGKLIRQSVLMPLLCCTLRPARPLRLLQLRSYGLTKLGLTRAQLIESEADQYAVTRAWGAALYQRAPEVDGLIWTSRQDDAAAALVLFGTRVRREELVVTATPRPLYPPGQGWQDLLFAADAAGILVVVPEED